MEWFVADHYQKKLMLTNVHIDTKQHITECKILPTVLENIVFGYVYHKIIVHYSQFSILYCPRKGLLISRLIFKINGQYVCNKKVSVEFELQIHSDKSIHSFEITSISANAAGITTTITHGLAALYFLTEDEYFNTQTCTIPCIMYPLHHNGVKLVSESTKYIVVMNKVVFNNIASIFKCILKHFITNYKVL